MQLTAVKADEMAQDLVIDDDEKDDDDGGAEGGLSVAAAFARGWCVLMGAAPLTVQETVAEILDLPLTYPEPSVWSMHKARDVLNSLEQRGFVVHPKAP